MGNCTCEKKPTELEAEVKFSNKEKRGVVITIHSVLNYTSKSSFRLGCYITEESVIILDSKGIKCAFYTPVYQDTRDPGPADSLYPRELAGNEIFFDFERFVNQDLQYILDNQGFKRNLYLIFQTLELSEMNSTERESELGHNEGSSPLSARYKTLANKEFKITGWAFFQLNNLKRDVQYGKFSAKVYRPPFLKPPYDEEKLVATNAQIEFSISSRKYRLDTEGEVSLMASLDRNKSPGEKLHGVSII